MELCSGERKWLPAFLLLIGRGVGRFDLCVCVLVAAVDCVVDCHCVSVELVVAFGAGEVEVGFLHELLGFGGGDVVVGFVDCLEVILVGLVRDDLIANLLHHVCGFPSCTFLLWNN